MKAELGQLRERIDPHRLRRFAEALDAAVHDVRVENGRTIQFYYDVDALHKAIMGYTLIPGDKPQTDTPREVLHALLTTSVTPQVRLLRPHLVEFNQLVHNEYGRDPHSYAKGWHRARMEYLTRIWGIAAFEADLRRISSLDRADMQREFLQFISRNGVEVFVKLQMCLAGTSGSRLRRMWKDGRFRIESHRFEEAFPGDNPKTQEFLRELNRARPRADAALSNIIDASALAVLSDMCADDGETEVRFYTETQPIRDLFSHAELGKLLTSRGDRDRSVLRDEHYFLVRTSFRALSFSREVRAGDAAGEHSFQDLETYSRDLNQALSATGSGAAAAHRLLHDVQLQGRPADIVLRDFYRLEFIRRVVLDWPIPEGMREWIPHLFDIYNSRQFMLEADEELAQVVGQVGSELSERIGGLKNWRRHYDEIYNATKVRRAQIRPDEPIPELSTDLGLGRWGLEYALVDPERITDTITRLIRSSPDEFALECSRVAALTATSVRAEDLEYLLCVLWFLQASDLLCQTFESAGPAQRLPPVPGFAALYYVSRVKWLAKKEGSLPRLQRKLMNLISEVESYVERFRGYERGYALMALAHVTYWAGNFLRELAEGGMPAARLPIKQRDQRSKNHVFVRLAQQSLRSAEAAMAELEHGSPAWYFAINHATYVGIATDLQPDATASYYSILLSAPRIRTHYRFADTLAFLHITAAKKQIAGRGYAALLNDPGLVGVRNDVCRNLRRAEEYFQTSGSWYGDEEVTQHRAAVDADLTLLRCAGS